MNSLETYLKDYYLTADQLAVVCSISTDELAALEVRSIDHVSFLVLPRIAALMVIAPVLTVLCDTIGILGGGATRSGLSRVRLGSPARRSWRRPPPSGRARDW